MPVKLKLLIAMLITMILSGCATTNSIPYKASTTNIISLQNTMKPQNTKVSVGSFSLANGVEEDLTCRMLGPVKVAPGKSLTTFIKEALQEELFLAQAYDPAAPVVIEATIEKIAFSSVSPANWEISMRVRSNKSTGYSVSVKYNYETSFDAWSACRNVADSFAPTVQELFKQVFMHPQFPSLVR